MTDAGTIFDPLAVIREGVVVPHLEVVVVGLPAPQGSKTKFKFGMVESSPHVKPWRDAVTEALLEVMGFDRVTGEFGVPDAWPLAGPLAASMVFSMPEPAAKAKLALRGRVWPDAKGRNDVSKLCRSTEDAITQVGAIEDDARIVEYVRLAKVFPARDPEALAVPGARVRLWALDRVTAPSSGEETVESTERG